MSHRQITRAGIDLIKLFEGFSPTVYLCSGNVKTIGYGHAIRKGEPWDNPTATITEERATELLGQDIGEAERAVLRLIRVPLTDGQFDSLVSWTFNLGAGSLQRSTLRSCLNREEYFEASNEFPKWCFAGGRKVKGLYLRRLREREPFLS